CLPAPTGRSGRSSALPYPPGGQKQYITIILKLLSIKSKLYLTWGTLQKTLRVLDHIDYQSKNQITAAWRNINKRQTAVELSVFLNEEI
ncbi:MAG: hypothetical protein IJS90_05905, partial [Clostridia bacterium]|nr:hypothetical protein [Clostridia bacterium]